MSLTNRILLAMAAGIALGSMLEWLLGVIDSGTWRPCFYSRGVGIGCL